MSPAELGTALGSAAAVVLTAAGLILRHLRKKNGQPAALPVAQPVQPLAPAQQYIDPTGDTGPYPQLTDSVRDMLSPVKQAQMMRNMHDLLLNMADRGNGHGYWRREEGQRLERKVDKMDGKVDRMSEQLAAQAATCAARTDCGRPTR